MKSDSELSRRNFVRNSLLAGGAAAVAAASASSASAASARKWDMTADIVCVGYGGAGAVTAISAADLGASVIVLEKLPADTPTEIRHTPNTRSSTALVVCPLDEKKSAEYLYATSVGKTAREYCERWCHYAMSNVEFLEKLGGKLGPLASNFRGDYHTLPGWDSIAARPYLGNGPALFKLLDDNVQKRAAKIKVLYETPGKELVQDANGVVLGVLAQQGGKTIAIKARKAVVMTTGGFENDEEMKKNTLYGYPAWFFGNPANTGDGIRMAAKAGADMWHFNSVMGRLTPHKDGYPGFRGGVPDAAILVNKYGKRFFRERPMPANSLPLETCAFDNEKAEFPALPCWSVFDEAALKAGEPASGAYKGLLNGKVVRWYEWSKDYAEEIKEGFLLKGATIEELAQKISADAENGGRMKPETLRATLDRYNGFCADKLDADLGRQPSTLTAMRKGPYYAMKLYPGGAMTTGGPKRNMNAQIVDSFNQPIPRLYGAGECGASFGLVYPMSGSNIADFLIFGRIAAENAMKETAL